MVVERRTAEMCVKIRLIIEISRKVPGINLMLGGHEHSPFSIFEEHTLIHKSGQNGQYLGRIDIHLDRNA